MSNNKQLWKHIGKQVFQESAESSIRSNRKPLKGFQIHFEEEQSQHSQYGEHSNSHRIRKIESLPEKFTNKEESVAYNRTPMIMTSDNDNKDQEEEVLQAISFESQDPKQMKDLNIILDSIKELQLKSIQQTGKFIQKQVKLQKNNTKKKLIGQRIATVYKIISQLKREFNKQKIDLLKSVCQWRVTVAKDCQKMNEALDKGCAYNEKDAKILHGMRSQNNPMSDRIREELQQAKLNLTKEKLNVQFYKKENEELKSKMRSLEINFQNKVQIEKYAFQQDCRNKIKILQNQLLSSITQKENALNKANKLKELANQRENDLLRQSQEKSDYQKRIQDFKNNIEDIKDRQRKLQSQLKFQQQKNQQQRSYYDKQYSKFKQQTIKLKQLLKNSQQQLSQCENYINSIINQSKIKNQQIKKLTNRIRQLQIQQFKKLQIFDKALIEIENDIVEISRNQQIKLEQIEKKQINIQKQREKIQYKEMKLNQKEFEINSFKNEVQNQMELLQRKECAMRAEYKMAINAQNATKERWYQRYYNTFADKPERPKHFNSGVITNDTGSLTYIPRQYVTKNEFSQLPVREKVPSLVNCIAKAKSQKNFGIYSPTRDIPRQKTRKLEIQKPESYRDSKISNKIETLRNQLTKQINNIAH